MLQEKYERGGEGNERVRDARKGVAGLKDQMNRNAEVFLLPLQASFFPFRLWMSHHSSLLVWWWRMRSC